MSLGQSLQKYTYQYLLEKALSHVPNTVDKREGSIIFDALAPACYVLAEYFMEMHRLSQEISIETASGEWLDNKVVEVGISRNQATAAIKKATFMMLGTVKDAQGKDVVGEVPATVPIPSRFATMSESNPLYYTVTDVYRDPNTGNVVPGVYEATCETVGLAGNDYVGAITPLDFITELASATLGEYITPGSETETDDSLRERYLTKVRYRAFGGNVAQYREMVLGLVVDGEEGRIGGVQIYPTWNGGGTVKLSIIDGAFSPVTEAFLEQVQQLIDPDVINGVSGNSGKGLGKAPIDHRVTVVTPEEYIVDITADIYLSNNSTKDQVESDIRAAIEQYFAQLRANWDNGDDMNNYSCVVYQSQIVRAALSVTNGVSDFSNVVLKKRGTSHAFTNITLTQSGTTQQLPILGTVTLNVKS